MINHTMTADIGVQLYAAHAPVVVTWKQLRAMGYCCRLYNSVLLNQDAVCQLKKLDLFFLILMGIQ